MDLREYNRKTWNGLVDRGCRWTVPVDAETIAAARRGEWSVVLTPKIPVPRDWFPSLEGLDILGLASGGGQQMPTFAAAGANVSLIDASEKQLGQDRLVAEREGLEIRTEQGDMADLGVFDDRSFDLVFHPCSNCFVSDVRPVWREAFRVLRPGGVLLSGFSNPFIFIFDDALAEKGELVVRNPLPLNEAEHLTPEQQQHYIDQGEPLICSHTLDDQIGSQLDAGFHLTAMFEDRDPEHALAKYSAMYIATRAIRPA